MVPRDFKFRLIGGDNALQYLAVLIKLTLNLTYNCRYISFLISTFKIFRGNKFGSQNYNIPAYSLFLLAKRISEQKEIF